jgi:hypothetical protein
MSTNVTFSNMLNQYLPEPLLFEDLKKRDWFMKNVEQDDSWLGGSLIVPFLGNVGSSVTFGSLAASTDIAEEGTVRGSVAAYKEVWSSMIFNETDLQQHGKINAQNFLRILPDALERHAAYLKGVISQSLMTGAYVAVLTANGDASGNFYVAQPDRFQINQKVTLTNSTPVSATGYIKSISLNVGANGTYLINLVTARNGATPVDLSLQTTALASTVYQDGQQANGFTSLRAQLLSAANGGSTAIFGVTKTAWPFTQSINVPGSDITSANILGKVFDAYVTIRRLGGGMPFKVVMSYKNFASCVKSLETQKGSFNVKPMAADAQVYGWTEIEVGGFAGTLTLVAVQEMDDDIIYFLDMKTIKFYTNGGIKRRKDPETGSPFYTIRNTTGYQYIVDHCIFGELVVLEPKKNGILFGISYT